MKKFILMFVIFFSLVKSNCIHAQKYINNKHCDGLVSKINELNTKVTVSNIEDWIDQILSPAVVSYVSSNFNIEGSENIRIAIEECKSCIISRLSGNTNANTNQNEKIFRAFLKEVEKSKNSPQKQNVCKCEWCSNTFTGYGFETRTNEKCTPRESANWVEGLCGPYCSPKCATEACWNKN